MASDKESLTFEMENDPMKAAPDTLSGTTDTSFTKSSPEPSDHHENESKKLPYPKWVAFIVASNFTERFSYYGMKAILTLFFVEKLLFSEKAATITYHVFCSLCYFTPVLGAIISDAKLGKFKTIIYFTIVYIIGGLLLAGSAIPGLFWGLTGTKIITGASLILIAVGSGCIKPCLAAFGGDQFGPGQEHQLDTFFSAFYVSISCGSLISMFLTPLLRSEPCFGQRSCYPLAFGMPALTITLGLVLIAIGRRWYTIQPPGNNVIGNVVSCVAYALKTKFSRTRRTGQKKAHWLDYADDQYNKELIADVKCLLKVFFLYIPLPLFYTLFDQQGSRWTLQATKLNGKVTEELYVQPDHMQLLNPLIVVAGAPLFDYVIYPVCAKINFLVKPLQRMVVGGLLAALAFFVACVLQMAIDSSLPPPTSKDMGTVMLLNAAPCQVRILSELANANMTPGNLLTLKDVPANVKQNMELHPLDCKQSIDKTGITFQVSRGEISTVAIIAVEDQLDFYRLNDSLSSGQNGRASVRVVFHLPDKQTAQNITFTFKHHVVGSDNTIRVSTTDLQDGNIGSTDYAHLLPGSYNLYTGEQSYDASGKNKFKFSPGGRYLILLGPDRDGLLESHVITITKGNTLSIFLQIPQYLLITFAEVMFAITGIQFSYSQAPTSMKSLVQAAWLILTAFGNVIMVIVSKMSTMKLALESLTFAIAMVIDMVIFAIMAYYYRYNDHVLLGKIHKEHSHPHDKAKTSESKTEPPPEPPTS